MKFEYNPDVLEEVLKGRRINPTLLRLMVMDEFMSVPDGMWLGFDESDYGLDIPELLAHVGLLQIEDQREVNNGLFARATISARMEYAKLADDDFDAEAYEKHLWEEFEKHDL